MLWMVLLMMACELGGRLDVQELGGSPGYFIECYCRPDSMYEMTATRIAPISEPQVLDYALEFDVRIVAEEPVKLYHSLYVRPGGKFVYNYASSKRLDAELVDTLRLEAVGPGGEAICAETAIPKAVEIDSVAEVIGDLDTEQVMVDTLAALKIPTNYVPKAELVFSAFYDNMSEVIARYYDSNVLTHGARPVIFCMNFNADKYGSRNVMLMGESVAEYAKLLFERIREAENLDYNLIIAEGVPMGGMGTTVLSRLIKLSGGKVI